MAGVIYGVGVGPGDPELLTIKAVRMIRECDVIGIPAKNPATCTAYQIALRAVPEITDKPVLAVPVPMTTDREKLDAVYQKGCERLVETLMEGKSIAFLNLGDPSIYGTYMELHKRVIQAGFQAELISGVPSFCAVAAALGIPLGSGNEAVHILPGCYRAEEVQRYDGCRILMKSGGRQEEVKEKLAVLEEEGRIKTYAVANCGMENQRIYENIQELDRQAGYFTTIVVKETGN